MRIVKNDSRIVSFCNDDGQSIASIRRDVAYNHILIVSRMAEMPNLLEELNALYDKDFDEYVRRVETYLLMKGY